MKKNHLKLLLLMALPILASCGNGGDRPSTNGGSNTSTTNGSTSSSLTASSSPTISTPDIPPSSGQGGESNLPVEGVKIPDKLVIHYQNVDKVYEDFAFWFWTPTNKKEIETPAMGIDDYGMYIELNPLEWIAPHEEAIWFLIKSIGNWTYKSVDTEIVFNEWNIYKRNGINQMDIYAFATNKSSMDLSDTLELNKDYVSSAILDPKTNKINVTASTAVKSYSLYGLTRDYYLSADQENIMPFLLTTKSGIDLDTFDIDFLVGKPVDYHTVYFLETVFPSNLKKPYKTNIDCSKLYETKEYQNLFYDKDDLGVSFDKDGYQIFKVFAPNAAFVRLNIYKYAYPAAYSPTKVPSGDRAYYNSPTYYVHMVPGENGIFTSVGAGGSWLSQAAKDDVKNNEYYYTYSSYTARGVREVVDPYAKSVGLNSFRGLIARMDSDKAMPDNFKSLPKVWDKDPIFDIESPQELVISENHIRDLTMSPTWSKVEDHKKIAGTYKAFAQEGTTYTQGPVTVKTGADHLEEYGVNALQILPFFDHDNLDTENKFNWGYNPLNYNSPEGTYSTDPYTGYPRIYELREMIAKYAKNANHTRIIMDVVYNHVSNSSFSNFEALAPGYYFRLDKDGSFLDNSGCGNEFKSESKMGRKFIVDSVSMWAKEYLIKGFRFDLMGLIDVETMKQVKEALYQIDPDIVVYGEGWDATGAYSGNADMANTAAVYKSLFASTTSPGQVGGFNDAGRDAIRGSNNGGEGYPGYGMISQGPGDLSRRSVTAVTDMLKGIHLDKGANINQTINYASCHDNYTLFDQLNWTLSPTGGVNPPSIDEVGMASIAVNGSILMSNGIAFINGGEEIFRTKIETDAKALSTVSMYGTLVTHNSYKSSDETNAYDYSRKIMYKKYYEMYVKLVAMRKNLLPVYENNWDNKPLIDTWNTEAGTTSYSLYRQGKDGSTYFVFFGGRSETSIFNIDAASKETLLFTNSPTGFTREGGVISSHGSYVFGIYH